MSHNRSSSNQNSRIFSPTVILQQPASRMVVTLDSSAGTYSMESGITAGDCLRFDTFLNGYLRSQADITDESKAEVFGIVESKSGTKYNVVTYGSIKYPPERLAKLQDPAYLGGVEDTKVDILFLDNDNTNIGGITGQVIIPTGTSSAIVKPVMQLAKHGEYDGLVINYMGYQIGNSAKMQFGEQTIGTIIQTSGNPGEDYLDLSVPNQMLTVVDNPILYSQFGIKSGTHYTDLVMASSANISSISIGSIVTQSSPAGNGSIGQVISTSGNTVSVRRTSNSQPVYNGYCTIESVTFQIISSSVTDFTLPVKTPERLSDGTLIKSWINTVPLTKVTIPEQLSISTLEVTGTTTIGAILDLEAKITEIENNIQQIKTRIGI